MKVLRTSVKTYVDTLLFNQNTLTAVEFKFLQYLDKRLF